MVELDKTVYPSLAGERVLPTFSKRNTLLDTVKAVGVGTLFGLNVVLVRNSLSPSRTVAGGLRGEMAPVGIFGLVGGAYTFGEAVSANLRGEETAWNSFAGGAAAGAVAGASLRTVRKSVAKSVGGALVLGFVCAAFTWGFDRGHDESVAAVTSTKTELTEEHPRQGFWELVHRRPLSQTVDELGNLAKQFVKD